MLRPKIAPMGWNSWDCYGAAVTENEVRQNAEFMASNRLWERSSGVGKPWSLAIK